MRITKYADLKGLTREQLKRAIDGLSRTYLKRLCREYHIPVAQNMSREEMIEELRYMLTVEVRDLVLDDLRDRAHETVRRPDGMAVPPHALDKLA